MNKFNIGDIARCIINYTLVECVVYSIYRKYDNITYEIEFDGFRYDMYDYELGKTKEELKSQLEQKQKDLQNILDTIK